ncbi:MAG: DEAD/DEAH box helicase [Tepidisphaeraceae bacterium]
MGLVEPILRALASEGYVTATPVQAQSIPPGLEGRDVLASAQTGTGKTAAFALPILQRLSSTLHSHSTGSKPRARCLVLCPTRELATQIADGFAAYGKHLHVRHTVIFGGVGESPQIAAVRRGVETIVATPGRLLDLMGQGHIDLRGIEVLVLDEADRMLDMGFIRDIRKIVAQIPAKRQTMFFSATMPAEIRQLADSMLKNPAVVQVAPVATPIEKIDQSVYFVEKRNKPQLLAHLVNELPMSRAIVFTRTKHGADKVVRHLHTRGIKAEAIHGNKSQNARERALANFRASKIPVLVATDIASRGIDIDGVSHVVNYDLTHEPETYVHRIGRTARAGASGSAVAFCDHEERENLRAIEKLIRRKIAVCEDHPVYLARAETPLGDSRQEQHAQNGQRHSHHAPASHQRSQGGNGRPQGGNGLHPARPAKPAHSHVTGRGVGGTMATAPAVAKEQPAAKPQGGGRPFHPVKGKPGVHRGNVRRGQAIRRRAF